MSQPRAPALRSSTNASAAPVGGTRARAGFAVRRGVGLATGSRPRTLPGREPDGRRVVTSDEALLAPGPRASLPVPRGGEVGVEPAERIVPIGDADVRRHLTRGRKKRDINVPAGARLLNAEVFEDGVVAEAEGGRVLGVRLVGPHVSEMIAESGRTRAAPAVNDGVRAPTGSAAPCPHR